MLSVFPSCVQCREEAAMQAEETYMPGKQSNPSWRLVCCVPVRCAVGLKRCPVFVLPSESAARSHTCDVYLTADEKIVWT